MLTEKTLNDLFLRAQNKPISIKLDAFCQYNKYFDSLKDSCARYPYSVIIQNPPDNNAMYFRKMNFNEFCSNRLVLLEFIYNN